VPAFSCPHCNYTLEGLGDATKVRCPECGRTYTWSGLQWWQQEGRHVPPITLLYWLIPVPTIALVFGLIGRSGSAPSGAFFGWAIAFAWATGVMAVMIFRGMRRNGSAFAVLMTVLLAPLAGAIIVGAVALAIGSLSLWT
jgi:hypothetical protein